MNQQQIAEVVRYATANKSRAVRMIKAMLKANAEDNGNGNGNGEAASLANSPISHLADLLCEAGEFPDRASALRYLLRNPHGTGMLSRLGPRAFAAKRENAASTTSAAVKALDHISEHRYTDIVTQYAKERYPKDTPAQAFTKVYEERSEEGQAIRDTRAMIKRRDYAAQTRKRLGDKLPFEVTLEPRETNTWSVDEAMKALNDLAAEQRKRAPWMSVEQAFSTIYADAANSDKVEQYKQARARALGA
jgi:hypothetical protein